MTAILTLPLEALCATAAWRSWKGLGRARTQLRCTQVRLEEIERLADARIRLRDRQQKIEHAVDSTTDSVEAVHRALADLSFDLWGRHNPAARQRHHEQVSQVYGSVRGVNRLIGKWTGSLLNGNSDSREKDRE